MAYFPETAMLQSFTAALEIQRNINKNDSLLPAGIGADIGNVILGDLGEYSRLDYTVIGSPVNHASRMCSLSGAGQITVSRHQGIVRHQQGEKQLTPNDSKVHDLYSWR